MEVIQAEFIDRSKCRRIVPMKVLCLGMSRTGTETMRLALRQLGYNDTYHGYATIFETPLDSKWWRKALLAKYRNIGKPFTRHDWDQLLGHCQAVTDLPAALFAEELVAAYPDAKVVLTLRDVDSWHVSCRNVWDQLYSTSTAIIHFVQILTLSPFRHSSSMWKLVHETAFRGSYAQYGKEVYIDHYERVRKLVPKDQLLEYEVADGWQPLCEFLEVPIPKDVEFPHANTGEDLRRKGEVWVRDQIRILTKRIAVIAGFVTIGWGLQQYGIRFMP